MSPIQFGVRSFGGVAAQGARLLATRASITQTMGSRCFSDHPHNRKKSTMIPWAPITTDPNDFLNNINQVVERLEEINDIRFKAFEEGAKNNRFLIGIMVALGGLGLAITDRSIKHLETKFDSLETNFKSLDAKVSSKLESLETDVSSVEAKVTSLDTKVTSLDTKVTSLEAEVTSKLKSLETDLKSTSSKVDEVIRLMKEDSNKRSE
jgi:chromosome segregation ATPase